MMHLLIGQEWSTEGLGHNKPVLGYVVLAMSEVAILVWYGNEAISASDCPFPYNVSDRDIGPWVSGCQDSSVVGRAIAPCLVGSIASFDLAHWWSFP